MQEGQGRRRPCHWTIYQELCQLIIRGRQILKLWRSLIQRLAYEMLQELLDQLQRLAKCAFRFHGKTPNGVISEEKEFILLGDLNCDLLPETIRKFKHLVHIYNTWSYAGRLPKIKKDPKIVTVRRPKT